LRGKEAHSGVRERGLEREGDIRFAAIGGKGTGRIPDGNARLKGHLPHLSQAGEGEKNPEGQKRSRGGRPGIKKKEGNCLRLQEEVGNLEHQRTVGRESISA